MNLVIYDSRMMRLYNTDILANKTNKQAGYRSGSFMADLSKTCLWWAFVIIKFSSSVLVCKQLILTKSPKQLDIIFRQISLKCGILLVILLILKVIVQLGFFACGALAASICVGIVIPSTWFVYLYKQTVSITVMVMGTKQFNDKTTHRQKVKTRFVQKWEMGKQKSRTFPGIFQDFFIFQGLNFVPILYNTTF